MYIYATQKKNHFSLLTYQLYADTGNMMRMWLWILLGQKYIASNG